MPRTIILLACIAMTPLSAATAYADEIAERDVAAVQKFLKEKYPNDTWGRGPTRLTGKAIEMSYPKSRFYYVFSPQYPVARVGQISAVVKVGDEEEPRIVQEPADFNHGLMAVENASEAKTAAAAIMSLILGPMGPQDVALEDVEVTVNDGGWTATVTKPQGRWQAAFDNLGKCTTANYKHTGPLPICIGGLFRVVSAPQGRVVGSQPADAALLVDSVELDSIAQRAGLKKGDLIFGFDGRPLPNGDTIQSMRQTVYALKQQQGVNRNVTLIRDGKTITASVAW